MAFEGLALVTVTGTAGTSVFLFAEFPVQDNNPATIEKYIIIRVILYIVLHIKICHMLPAKIVNVN
jgi:hypothetical protein